jgi:hypothetical protein
MTMNVQKKLNIVVNNSGWIDTSKKQGFTGYTYPIMEVVP